jgi:uncharacterized protein YjaZ
MMKNLEFNVKIMFPIEAETNSRTSLCCKQIIVYIAEMYSTETETDLSSLISHKYQHIN